MKRLDRETREKLLRAYIEHVIATRGELPTVREVKEVVGGNIHTITRILSSYRERGRKEERRFISEYERRLIQKGLLRRLPPGMSGDDFRSYEPVEVKGKPLSESIVEGRR